MMEAILLSIDDFREYVLRRDDHKCVICKEYSEDVQHIMDSRLFDNGGYFIDNGVTLCKKHYIEAQMTNLSCEKIREAACIAKTVLPYHLYDEYRYDKWGNIILPNGQRIIGELFYDKSIQDILSEGGVLGSFSKYVKYPRSMHLPWSDNLSTDDKQLTHEQVDFIFKNKEVVVTVKMDGENTTMYDDYIHARSIDSIGHQSRNWVKGLWSSIAYQIPEGWRICGENLFAKHTIDYTNLDTYFLVFSWWNDRNECLSWDDTVEYSKMIGLQTVPVIYKGLWDEGIIKSLFNESFNENKMEGYVVRIAESFPYGSFRKSLAKFVSKKFQINQGRHWMRDIVTPNRLKGTTEIKNT